LATIRSLHGVAIDQCIPPPLGAVELPLPFEPLSLRLPLPLLPELSDPLCDLSRRARRPDGLLAVPLAPVPLFESELPVLPEPELPEPLVPEPLVPVVPEPEPELPVLPEPELLEPLLPLPLPEDPLPWATNTPCEVPVLLEEAGAGAPASDSARNSVVIMRFPPWGFPWGLKGSDDPE
jgi:hypothetical protein